MVYRVSSQIKRFPFVSDHIPAGDDIPPKLAAPPSPTLEETPVPTTVFK